MCPSESGVMNEPCRNPDRTKIAGKRVTVMGLGSFGGGAAAVRFFAERGAIVRVSDQRSAEQLEGTLAQLGDLKGIDWQLGEHQWSHFSDADFVVLNPAVPPRHSIVQQLEAASIPLTSEMNLFWKLNRGRVIAVTGSNGKSTTTALIHSIIQANGQRCWLGGNIGRSLLPHVGEIAADDWVILELSSFQLRLLDQLKARPDIAVVTNFAPNHLDWHGTLDDYRLSKQAILRWQTADDRCVLNGNDADVASWPRSSLSSLVFGNVPDDSFLRHSPSEQNERHVWLDASDVAHFGTTGNDRPAEEMPIRDWCNLRGHHNLLNALLASTAARLAGASLEAVRIGLEQFEVLPHRLQFVAEINQRQFYNDSISTTPESTIAALDSFEEPVVILAGGYDKQVDLASLAIKIAERAKAASLLGQTAPALKNAITTINARMPVSSCPDFDRAFSWAVKQSSPGDVILLSPGCASYDWFENFVDRGKQFCRLVGELNNQEPSSEKISRS